MSGFPRKNRGTKNDKIVHIFCEGERTEPLYFEGMKLDLRKSNINIHGMGMQTQALVDHAKKEARNDDEVWIIMDEDGKHDFNNAIDSAKAANFEIAYSNECFEIWFLLHFQYSTSPQGRNVYYRELLTRLKELDPGIKITSYKKNGKSISNIYNLLKDKQSTAIKNSKMLEKFWNEQGELLPSNMKPRTMVHHLVLRLLSL